MGPDARATNEERGSLLADDEALLDRYELLGRVGEGGYGEVHAARDRNSGERVALKQLTHVNPATLARFKREFRAVQQVNHPNLVRLDGLFEDQGRWLIAMELVEGKDLLSHLYDAELANGFAEERLRHVFLQLAAGLSALHAAGFVHRDLKPANVRVTEEGRVVLLDFGLAMALDSSVQNARASGFGTIAYMAPEQAANRELGPAADWYAFGVCLYEAMTGLLPIDAEGALELLEAKQSLTPPPPSHAAPGIPRDLDRLCSDLLALVPASRPQALQVKDVLAHHTEHSAWLAPAVTTTHAGRFAGREAELERLEQAFASVQTGTPRVVLVEGESGIGKSALIGHFVAGVQRKDDVLVLRSRCYENELLPYKAFDGAMDGLADVLSRLEPQACAALLPARAGLLCRLFPALSEVKALAESKLDGVAADPAAQQLEAFSVLGRLLARISERRPIVLLIDDLQWADAESFRLLQTLLGGTQPASALILVSVRPRAELEGDAKEGIDGLRRLSCTHDLPLRGLPRVHARALARELMGSRLSDAYLEVMVEESAGHPLFLSVLGRFVERRDPRHAGELSLEAAIAAQLDELTEAERKLMQTVAVVGSPLLAPLCGRVVGLQELETARAVADLCRKQLLRRRGAGEISCFHDRIRSVVVAGLSPGQAQQLHARVAAVLEEKGADPAELGRHFQAAGDSAHAYAAYLRGAERAASLLAFARAASLYARALEVSVELALEPSERTALKIASGHVLARGGRSAEAARQYLAAAAEVTAEDQTRLRIWAAQHLIQSGSMAEGMAAARALLAELDVGLPQGAFATMAALLWDRTCLRVRGLELGTGAPAISARNHMQLDALWGLSLPMAWLDPLKGAALTARHLRKARALAEPAHMVRGLAEEAFTRALEDPKDPSADVMLAQARELVAGARDPALHVCVAFREGTVATFRWELARARERLEFAQRLAVEACPDQPWLLANVRVNLGPVWANVGEHALLAAATAGWVAEAEARNDRFAAAAIEGVASGAFRHLMADDPDLVRMKMDAALAVWPREGFSFGHFGELLAVLDAELYRGGDGAYAWIERERARLSGSVLLKTGFGRATYLTYELNALLAARAVATGRQAAQLLRKVHSCLRRLRRVNVGMATVTVPVVEAELLALDGQFEAALALARHVRERCEASNYVQLAYTMQYFEGLLEGGGGGRAKQVQALAAFGDQGWKQPRRLFSMTCAALDELEARRGPPPGMV